MNNQVFMVPGTFDWFSADWVREKMNPWSVVPRVYCYGNDFAILCGLFVIKKQSVGSDSASSAAVFRS